MSALWGADDAGVEEEGEEGELGYGGGYGGQVYEDDEDNELANLSPQDVEQLVEKYLHTRRRADELESENAKLTKQLMEMSHSEQCKDTLVIHVSPEMW